MLGRNAGWECRLQYLAKRGNVIVRNPSAELEYVGPQKGRGVDDVRDGMDFDAGRRFHLKSSDKSFDLAVPKWDGHPASHLNGLRKSVNECSCQGQANGDVRIHALGTQTEKLGANLLHVFPDFAFLLR